MRSQRFPSNVLLPATVGTGNLGFGTTPSVHVDLSMREGRLAETAFDRTMFALGSQVSLQILPW